MVKCRREIASIVVAIFTIIYCFGTVSVGANQQTNVEIIDSGGWFESVYVKWNKFGDVKDFNVYYSLSDEENYIKVDDELVRGYSGFFRSDIMGILPGSYIIKVVPVINGIEDESKSSLTETIEVMSYVREGFAFSPRSPQKTTNGGYNDDGTIKSNANIIYVSNANKDTVMINGDRKKGVGLVGIFAYRTSKKSSDPLIVRFLGKVEAPKGLTEDAMLKMNETKNITIEGVGDDATIYGWSLAMKRSQNMEIRNIGIMFYGGGTDGDGVSMDTENKNVWLHNVDFFYGFPGKDSDQVKGDGAIDLKSKTDYITVNNNHFWDSGKTAVSGGPYEAKNPNDSEAKIFVTYHHNWFDHSDSRHPRCVAGSNHVYNNYYDGVALYGIGAAVQSSLFVENNYFRNCGRPMIIATQGSDVYDSNTGTYASKGTLSGQTGGMIKEFGNHIEGEKRFVNQYTTPDEGQIDAFSVSSRDEKIPSAVTAMSGGSTYNNFDTDALMYSYNVESAEESIITTMKYSGRMNGGDFKWSFDNSTQDTNKEIIPELKTAMENYTCELEMIGGKTLDELAPQPPTPEPTLPPEYIGGKEYLHIFTQSGVESNFYNIAGSIKKGYGSMEYKGENLETCLEMGGNTLITFKAPKDGIFKMQFNPDYSNSISVRLNDSKYLGDKETGTLVFDVREGSEYTITRDVTCYLFYMSLQVKADDEILYFDTFAYDESVLSYSYTELLGIEDVDYYVAVYDEDNNMIQIIINEPSASISCENAYSVKIMAWNNMNPIYSAYSGNVDELAITPSPNPTYTPDPQITPDPDETPDPNKTPEPTPSLETIIHNFTSQGNDSTFFNITGDLSTNYGPVTYKDLILTQCHKIGSSTNISFNPNSDGTLTLVFLPNDRTTVKVNGKNTNGDVVSGILEIDVTKDTEYVITKSSSALLFYMELNYK